MRSAELAITSLISNKRELLNSFKKFEARNTSAKSKKIRAKSNLMKKRCVNPNVLKIDLMSFSLRTRLSHCGINGKHHAISLNNGRKHTIIVRYLNDEGLY